MKIMMIILFSAILVDNFVLSRFLGICSFLGLTSSRKTSMGMSLAVIFTLTAATAFTWPVSQYILKPLNLGYLQTLTFILIIAALVQCIEAIMKKAIPPLYNALGIYLPLITTNCAVLGLVILNVDYNYNFLQSIVNSLGAGLGYMLAMFIFAGIRSKVDHADIPESLKGLPITLISAALLSISFFGFKGLIEKLFA